MIYILTFLGIAVGMAIGYLAAHNGMAKTKAEAGMAQQNCDRLQSELAASQTQAKELADERTGLVARRDVLQSQLNALQDSIQTLKEDHAARIAELKAQGEATVNAVKEDAAKQRAEMQAHYQQQLNEFHSQQRDQMEQQSKLIKEQINSASEEILKKRSDELSTANREQLNVILNPLKDNLRQMKEAVEKSDREHTTSMERLDASIKANLKQAQEVGERADKLAQALTSENKVQGNFGELRLRTLLENMGLEEGVQFEEQATMKDAQGSTLTEEGGHRMIPDVILHFPDNRDIIIDSKMSLKAFEDYYNADTQEAKDEALNRHIASVRSHVKELAHKNYSSYIKTGNNKLDFVIMYIYSESAVQLALANDPSLWREAYDQGVIISGSQNLYMMLRVLEMTWRQTRQAENQDKIMDAANELVNRVQMFYERFSNADDLLGRTQKAFDELKKTTAPTGKSIVTAANKLIKFGAKENPKRKLRLPKGEGDDEESLSLAEDKQ